MVICCYLGNESLMVDGQKLLIDACIEEGVPRYIASDWSLDYRALKMGDLPSKDPMKQVYAYLQDREKEGKIHGVHVLNGAFMEVMWASFMGLFDETVPKFTYWGTGDGKSEMTTMADAAAYTAEIASDPSVTGVVNGKWSMFHVRRWWLTVRSTGRPQICKRVSRTVRKDLWC